MPSKKVVEIIDYAGVVQGEVLNAFDRKTTIPLNGARMTTLKLNLDHPFAPNVLALDSILRVKRGGINVGTLPLMSAEETVAADGGTVQVIAADPLVDVLPFRLIGKGVDAKGKGVGYTQGTPLAPVDTGTIAKGIVDVTNAADGFTGVATNAAWITASTSKAVGPWYFKPISEALLEMSAPLDGYDFELKPVDPVDVGLGFPKLCELWIYAAKGTTRNDVIFEYGTGKANIESYSRPRTKADMINRAYALPNGFPDSAAQIQAPTPGTDPPTGDLYQTVIANTFNAATEIARWKLREAVVNGDLGVDLFRQKLADEHVRIRRAPREQITFVVAANSEYQYGVDYVEGDLIEARAKVNGEVRFDAFFRIYQVELTDDDAGNERVTLTVVPS